MLRSIGTLIILWGISFHFGSSMKAFDEAATATFKTVTTAAVVSEQHITEFSQE